MGRRRKGAREVVPQGPVLVEDLDHDGRGVSRSDGKVAFIDGALPGELVTYQQLRNKRTYVEGTMLTFEQPSPLRVEPGCPHFGQCGGCRLQHLDATAQTEFKQAQLLQTLARVGGVAPERVLPPLTADPWGYRSKARLGARYVHKKGRMLVGFREKNGRYLADMSGCEVLIPAVGKQLGLLAEAIAGLDSYQSVPQIEVAAGDMDIALVFRNLVAITEADRERLLALGRAQGWRIFLQPGGPESVHAMDGGDELLSYQLPEYALTFRFRPTDFTQVNAKINRLMVSQALKLLAPAEGETILDLFCGIGNFTLPIARSGARVTGVEGDAALVQRAQDNAKANGLNETLFVSSDLTQMAESPDWMQANYDKILLDPPRSGAFEMMAWLGASGAQRIVYVSCNPATLARDLGELVTKHGFQLKAAGIMDMFPHTAHVESIALLER